MSLGDYSGGEKSATILVARQVYIMDDLKRYLDMVSESAGIPVDDLIDMPYRKIIEICNEHGIAYRPHMSGILTGLTREDVAENNRGIPNPKGMGV